MGDDENWIEPESIWEMRRKAPAHFHAKADNARMSAYALSHFGGCSADAFASKANYGGTPSIALHEGFKREASIAMELILKAIICAKKKSAPPAIHDVYKLWSKACLPEVSEEDYCRLAYMAERLYWSGRYGAPRRDKDLNKYDERILKHKKFSESGKIKFVKYRVFGWGEFDALYQMARQEFFDIVNNKDYFS